MKRRVILLSRAQRHIRQIVDWMGGKSRDGANRWLDELDAALVTLENDPERFPPAPESAHVPHEVRELSFQTPHGARYRLLFTIVQDEVRVLCLSAPGQDHAAREDLN